MTRKDYEAFAESIRVEVRNAKLEPEGSDLRAEMLRSAKNMAEMCSDIFHRDNGRFDRNRFMKACGLV